MITLCFHNRLRESGLLYKFVTNTTKESQQCLYRRLRSIGFEVEMNEIFTSLIAARDFVGSQKLRPHLLVANEALEDFAPVIEQTKKSCSGKNCP